MTKKYWGSPYNNFFNIFYGHYGGTLDRVY